MAVLQWVRGVAMRPAAVAWPTSRRWAAAAAGAGVTTPASVPTLPTAPVAPSGSLQQSLSARPRLRNIGISAHIDSGKTTLTERVLYYTGRIRAIHEVRGKDGIGAKMDFMDLEREKGITIQSAATHCEWTDPAGHINNINVIDTPGHVDFTIEVERALRVLDGAVLVLCAVSGVQSQSLTVDRQMRRYRVPRITFINKLDRQGANPWRVIEQVRDKLRLPCAAVQIPMGLEDELAGVVDLVAMQAVFFDGPQGETPRRAPIPDGYLKLAGQKRKVLIEALADVDDQLADKFLMEEDISNLDISRAITRVTATRKFSPVLMGSALKNTGVQALLDAVVEYLPSPDQSTNIALQIVKNEDGNEVEQEVALSSDPSMPLVTLAFKLEDGKFGQLTYLRVYQGTLSRGGVLINSRTGKKVKVPRLVRMHGSDMEDMQEAKAGDICAIFGLECASGDTFVSPDLASTKMTLESLFVPEPVMGLAVAPVKKEAGGGNFSKALNRFTREDPTFRVHTDHETKETIISGMGELHLEIYLERMRREYGVDTVVGAPRVNYRETVTRKAAFDYVHKKQSGGSGQFGGVIGYVEPSEDGKVNQFVNATIGNNIPPQFLPAINKGFTTAVETGSLAGYPIQGLRFVLEDGKAHAVDSNEIAFRTAAIMAIRQAFSRADAIVLEPYMAVEVQVPSEYQGSIMGSINKRRGIILNATADGEYVSVDAEVPLGEMFGYSTELRSLTAGRGEYTMEFKDHRATSAAKQADLIKEFAEKRREE